MPKILLVDDTDSVRASLSRILKHNGFEVVEAANVNDALKLIGPQTFDVLLIDLHTPDSGDGLAIFRHDAPFQSQSGDPHIQRLSGYEATCRSDSARRR
jgi:CheY-like chemotaxis protein